MVSFTPGLCRRGTYLLWTGLLYKSMTANTRKDYLKKYQTKNKDKVLAYAKKYRGKNNDKILAYQKDYRIKNRDNVLIQKKKYYAINRVKALARSKKHDQTPKGKLGRYKHSARKRGFA